MNRTVGRIIRFERDGRVQFLGTKGPVDTLEEARVFLYDRVAHVHNARTTYGKSQRAVQAHLDDQGRAARIHPQWLKTGEQIEEERAKGESVIPCQEEVRGREEAQLSQAG